jgi:hypothetical protein
MPDSNNVPILDSLKIFELCKKDFYETIVNYDDLDYYGSLPLYKNDSMGNVIRRKHVFEYAYEPKKLIKLSDDHYLFSYILNPADLKISVFLDLKTKKAYKIGHGRTYEFCMTLNEQIKDYLKNMEDRERILPFLFPANIRIEKVHISFKSENSYIKYLLKDHLKHVLLIRVTKYGLIEYFEFEDLMWKEYICYPYGNHISFQVPLFFTDSVSWNKFWNIEY